MLTDAKKSRYKTCVAAKSDHKFQMNQEHCLTGQCISHIKYPLLFIATEAAEVGSKVRKWEETCPAFPVDEIPGESGSKVWWLVSQVWEIDLNTRWLSLSQAGLSDVLTALTTWHPLKFLSSVIHYQAFRKYSFKLGNSPHRMVFPKYHRRTKIQRIQFTNCFKYTT